MRISALVEKTQNETTQNVTLRAQLVGKWKTTLENAIKAMADEISTLEEERVRLKKSLVILGVPESIGKNSILGFQYYNTFFSLSSISARKLLFLLIWKLSFV